jgi:hypothetical protein
LSMDHANRVARNAARRRVAHNGSPVGHLAG